MKACPTREQALSLLRKYNSEHFHIQHALTVEGVMRWYANELGYGEDPQRLGACAVVRQRNEEAPYVAADWLRQYGAG